MTFTHGAEQKRMRGERAATRRTRPEPSVWAGAGAGQQPARFRCLMLGAFFARLKERASAQSEPVDHRVKQFRSWPARSSVESRDSERQTWHRIKERRARESKVGASRERESRALRLV